MKVFQSLNCVLCKLPFARKAKELRSPRHLNCGLAMCHECFQKEKWLKRKERKHQCAAKYCLHNTNFAYFLIDVLSQEDALALSPSGDGYLLAKPFKISECIICHDEFSNEIEQKKSRALACNHIICMECYTRIRKPNHDLWKKDWPYKCVCPSCNQENYVRKEKKNRFQDFLKELPEMTRQMPEIQGHRVCDGCEDAGSMDKMIYCLVCSSKICALCALEKHRFHVTTRLLKKEAHELFETLQKDSTNVVETYENLFPEMHKGIMQDISNFKTKLALKEEKDGKDILKFEDIQRNFKESTKLKTDFEASAEELMPSLRRFETKVKGLIQTLDKDLVLNVYDKQEQIKMFDFDLD